MNLPKLVSAYRKTYKVSLRKLAKRIGIEPTALFRFERGRSVSNDKWTAIMVWVMDKK